MKQFKASICSLAAFASLSYIHSAEQANDGLWTQLKSTLSASPKRQIQPDAIDEGFSQISKDLASKSFPISIPPSLIEFHKNVGNLNFTKSVVLLSPIKRVDETQCYFLTQILNAKKQGLGHEWLIFAQMDGNDCYCIHTQTGRVQLFSLIPQAKGHNEYDSIETWAKKVFLER